LSQNAYTTDDYISEDEGDLEKSNFQIAMVNPDSRMGEAYGRTCF